MSHVFSQKFSCHELSCLFSLSPVWTSSSTFPNFDTFYRLQARYLMECPPHLVYLSDSLICEHCIQILHVWQECHRRGAEYFSLHLIRWCISIWAITGDAYFDHLIMVRCQPSEHCELFFSPL